MLVNFENGTMETYLGPNDAGSHLGPVGALKMTTLAALRLLVLLVGGIEQC
jgi:hypothetical protein